MARKQKNKHEPKPAPQTSTEEPGSKPDKSGKQGQRLPAPRVKLAQIDTLVALVRRLENRLRNIEERQEAEHQRREQERQEQERRAAAPTPPALREDLFARLTEFMAKMTETVQQIASSVQQPVPAASDDAPPSLTRLRRSFSGACKTLDHIQPTPAIIGLVMRDKDIFTREDNRAPRALFEAIYARPRVPDHLSPRIRSLLERYGRKPSQTDTPTESEATSLNQPQHSRKKPKAASSKIAEDIGEEFDKRFELIVNMGYGKKETVLNGGKTNYCRYLTPDGRELFNGWPEWSDATGGIGLADEQAESPTSQPDRADADGGATQPAT